MIPSQEIKFKSNSTLQNCLGKVRIASGPIEVR